MKHLIKVGLLLFIFGKTFGQETVSFGVSGAYNFPMENIAFGLRGNIPVARRIAVSPQLKYAPGINNIHEIMGGVNLHFNILNNVSQKGAGYISDPKKPVVYVIGGVMYNRWINYVPSLNSRAKLNNILAEAGIGIAAGGNLIKFFAEAKYNILWNESSGEIGVLFYPFNKRPSKLLKCP